MTDCYLGVGRIREGASLQGTSSVFMLSPQLIYAKNAGGHPPALGGPSIRGYRYLYTRSYVPGLREAFGSTDSLPKNKNAGGIPRPLTALHKGTQPIYTMASVRMADSIEPLFL